MAAILSRAYRPGSWLIAGLIYWSVLVFFVVCAWPAKDVAFAEHRGLDNLHLLPAVAKAGLAGAFTGYWITALILIALSLPLLWRGGGWLFFLLATAAFCLFGTIVYAQLWHFGILFLAWLFAIWISAYKTRVTAPTLLALIAAIGFQCYWTAAAVRYDWSHAYSGSLAVAQYFRQTRLAVWRTLRHRLPNHRGAALFFLEHIFRLSRAKAIGIGRKQTPPTILARFSPRTGARWCWLATKNVPEKQHWADLLALLGYGPFQHFDGGTFWQTRVFELESYDLYRKTSNPRAASSVNMADPAQAAQLLSGFYDIEGGKSRWTAKNLLRSIAGAAGLRSERCGSGSQALYPRCTNSEPWPDDAERRGGWSPTAGAHVLTIE